MLSGRCVSLDYVSAQVMVQVADPQRHGDELRQEPSGPLACTVMSNPRAAELLAYHRFKSKLTVVCGNLI